MPASASIPGYLAGVARMRQEDVVRSAWLTEEWRRTPQDQRCTGLHTGAHARGSQVAAVAAFARARDGRFTARDVAAGTGLTTKQAALCMLSLVRRREVRRVGTERVNGTACLVFARHDGTDVPCEPSPTQRARAWICQQAGTMTSRGVAAACGIDSDCAGEVLRRMHARGILEACGTERHGHGRGAVVYRVVTGAEVAA